jgi:hypothetical protein
MWRPRRQLSIMPPPERARLTMYTVRMGFMVGVLIGWLLLAWLLD